MILLLSEAQKDKNKILLSLYVECKILKKYLSISGHSKF